MSLVEVVVLPVLVLAVLAAMVRLVIGPDVPDRVMALDFMTTAGIGIMGAYAIFTEQAVYLDVAMVVGLVGFLGTIAFAYYIELRAKADHAGNR